MLLVNKPQGTTAMWHHLGNLWWEESLRIDRERAAEKALRLGWMLPVPETGPQTNLWQSKSYNVSYYIRFNTSEFGPWMVLLGYQKGVAQSVSVCFSWPLTVHLKAHLASSLDIKTPYFQCRNIYSSTVILDSTVQPQLSGRRKRRSDSGKSLKSWNRR